MKLTKNFNLNEFSVSDQFPELAAEIEFTESDKLKLYYLCSTILQPVRDEFNVPIKILSGKRTEALNNAVGGSVNSDHLYRYLSCAADFTVIHENSRLLVYSIFDWISKTCKCGFGQLIWYGEERNFIHVSLSTPKHRGEVFKK